MNKVEVARLTDCLACFESGTECKVIHRAHDGSSVVEFENPRALMKLAGKYISFSGPTAAGANDES
ncbi:hypothetical protein BSL82_02100 [Tardibacter chloracetimidivorans]|uniref:Uncharacterized protein n=1 Tax=Tardibacter chloracetimidivorans TaxID=1921510 RepID=A0A1L3ZRI8_9SPHN|nr:hypothetical protein [Tardibacter chloracetimidivorans]API58242.1 hypothetical protein BSL82_02100 [Tardibacter chloracetimidivorans]